MLRSGDEIFGYPQDTPYRRFQQVTPRKVCSPSLFIQSSVKSRSIFKRQSIRVNNSSKHTKQYVADFDEQMHENDFSFRQPSTIHHTLSSVFKQNAPTVNDKQDATLLCLLESIQSQMFQLDTSIENLEKKIYRGKTSQILNRLEIQGDHQLVYINQNVDGLVGRLQNLLNQNGQSKNEEDQSQTLFTFNKNLNKFSKIYPCKFCNMKFAKACSLGGHISRTHKDESQKHKQDVLPLKKMNIQKRKKLALQKAVESTQ